MLAKRRSPRRVQFSLSRLLGFVTVAAVLATLFKSLGYHAFFALTYAVLLLLFIRKVFRLHEPDDSWPALTAIELLVIISVIAVLHSLTLPAVQTGNHPRPQSLAPRADGK